MSLDPDGLVLYAGPSRLRPTAPIFVALTGLTGTSKNSKSGPMVQAWILRSDMPPMQAKRENQDDAICGDCALRGVNGNDSICYVPAWLAPYNVYKAYHAGHYLAVDALDAAALLEDRDLRLSAYGDVAATAFELWAPLFDTLGGWAGYTHQWRACDPRWQAYLMASVESVDAKQDAERAGWRTFRMRHPFAPLQPDEFMCPASDEAGHRTTCQHCQLCRGHASPAKGPSIIVHGKLSSLTAFYRNQGEAEAAAWA